MLQHIQKKKDMFGIDTLLKPRSNRLQKCPMAPPTTCGLAVISYNIVIGPAVFESWKEKWGKFDLKLATGFKSQYIQQGPENVQIMRHIYMIMAAVPDIIGDRGTFGVVLARVLFPEHYTPLTCIMLLPTHALNPICLSQPGSPVSGDKFQEAAGGCESKVWIEFL